MPKNLTVIFGAGAAVDVVNPESNQVRNAQFRPEITANLFHTHRNWETEYSRFPNVVSVIEELRQSMPPNRTSIDVENFLKQLKESNKSHRNIQFREFPLYLQHYFTAVSDNYCIESTNYMTLINKIFDFDIDRVVFLTTNYDLLFDKALYKHPHTQFSISDPNMNKYIASNEQWAYIKLHGSVDWGRRIKKDQVRNKSNTLAGLIDNVTQLGKYLEQALENEIIRDKTFNQEHRELLYPAISVPIGESKLNCPDKYINFLKEHLNKCYHFLVIGFSGFDTDVLKLLDEKEGGFNRIMFVSGSKESANTALNKFCSYRKLGERLQINALTYPGNGFDEFIRSSNGLDEYLKSLI